jgi:hypothetical protein
MIAAATGGGSTTDYVLMSQARTRLPIFPQCPGNGHMPVSSTGAGNVTLPANFTFLHRGIFPVTTQNQTFATVANKIYHLRWNSVDGFVLKDLLDVGYNSGALAESNKAFDSTYDNMLIARVVTNSNNIPTITTLRNVDKLFLTATSSGPGSVSNTGGIQDGVLYSATFDLNWSRAPELTVVKQFHQNLHAWIVTNKWHSCTITSACNSAPKLVFSGYELHRHPIPRHPQKNS